MSSRMPHRRRALSPMVSLSQYATVHAAVCRAINATMRSAIVAAPRFVKRPAFMSAPPFYSRLCCLRKERQMRARCQPSVMFERVACSAQRRAPRRRRPPARAARHARRCQRAPQARHALLFRDATSAAARRRLRLILSRAAHYADMPQRRRPSRRAARSPKCEYCADGSEAGPRRYGCLKKSTMPDAHVVERNRRSCARRQLQQHDAKIQMSYDARCASPPMARLPPSYHASLMFDAAYTVLSEIRYPAIASRSAFARRAARRHMPRHAVSVRCR